MSSSISFNSLPNDIIPIIFSFVGTLGNTVNKQCNDALNDGKIGYKNIYTNFTSSLRVSSESLDRMYAVDSDLPVQEKVQLIWEKAKVKAEQLPNLKHIDGRRRLLGPQNFGLVHRVEIDHVALILRGIVNIEEIAKEMNKSPVEILYSEDFVLHIRDSQFGPALLFSCKYGCLILFEKLREDPRFGTLSQSQLRAVMIEASANGHTVPLLTLLKCGALLQSQECVSISFDHALEHGHIDTLHALVDSGLFPKELFVQKLISLSAIIEVVDMLLASELMKSVQSDASEKFLIEQAKRGNIEALHSLMKSEHFVHIRPQIIGHAVDIASGNGHLDIVRLLIEETNVPTEFIHYANESAKLHGQNEVVRYLESVIPNQPCPSTIYNPFP